LPGRGKGLGGRAQRGIDLFSRRLAELGLKRLAVEGL
jgi:hypothetical protein